ncbi:thiolase family protein [Actinomadura sp. LD22]|uniref:Probable acetyl-CoA acetyltransferase n=1 Tax=Actinomadura physcomitrii TaxID=2650748 RepID=A0A6I4MM11_9ACTN|nr:thiolase family protein [Actinomadura physcomitrii]MWA03256.1 thiolase family protein [Actinomadura physcomitrii]
MRLSKAAIPLGHAWSSPFARWQGPLANVNAIDLAVEVAGRALKDRNIDPETITYLAAGATIPQAGSFYLVPGIAARLGFAGVTGPAISQACATSAATIQAAAVQVETGAHDLALAVTTDRTSNGPTMVYPVPSRPGGAPVTEHGVLDPIARDPATGQSMLDTAENVAAEAGYAKEELDEVALLRYEQYRAGHGVRARVLVEVDIPGRKSSVVLREDHGIHDTTAEGLAKLGPARPGGVVSFGTQTHPADGTAGTVVASLERARELGAGVAQILSVNYARVEAAHMPKAPVPAALAALRDAEMTIEDVDVVATHNPFAVNDLYFSRETGFPLDRMNPAGCSLVYGHPQGPTGARAVAELIEVLRERGGGVGLFTGCAAGDTAGALVLRVTD